MISELIFILSIAVFMIVSLSFVLLILRDRIQGRYKRYYRFRAGIENFESEVLDEEKHLFDKGKHL